MKICHLTSVHPSEDTRIFYKEATSLAQNGYDTFLVAKGESYEKHGVHIVGVGKPSGGRLGRMYAFTKRVYQTALQLDADIYHLHDPELLPYGLKLKKQGKKVIFDSHEFTAEAILEKDWLPQPVRKMMSILYGRYEASICRQLDAVISVSPHIVRYYSRFNGNTIQITNYPTVTEQFHAPSFENRRILFAGGITPQWMHESILKALEQNPDCRYTLCGPCGEEYLKELQALPGWSQTDYLGKIPHTEVAQQMQNAYIGLALLKPSRNTDGESGTMGNTKIFEEMMAGLPVICTNFQLWKEFVTEYQCGICVDPNNIDEIARAIRYLLDHPEEARRMGENGRRAVLEKFNWKIEERKLLSLYQSLSDNCGQKS